VDVALRPRSGDDWPFRLALAGSGIENDLVGHHDISLNGIVTLPYDEIWQAAHPAVLDGAAIPGVYLMCPEDQLLALCVNACRKRFFRLKALFDIAETAAHYPAFDWDGFARRVRQSHAGGVVFTALYATDVTVGLPAGARVRYQALVSAPRRLMLTSMTRLMQRCDWERRFPLIALQYASFTLPQCWRSVTSVRPRPGHTLEELAEGLLPGES
jgi:hypothetical protein